MKMNAILMLNILLARTSKYLYSRNKLLAFNKNWCDHSRNIFLKRLPFQFLANQKILICPQKFFEPWINLFQNYLKLQIKKNPHWETLKDRGISFHNLKLNLLEKFFFRAQNNYLLLINQTKSNHIIYNTLISVLKKDIDRLILWIDWLPQVERLINIHGANLFTTQI